MWLAEPDGPSILAFGEPGRVDDMHTPKILTLATLSVFMALTCVARAAQSAWIAKAPLPTARFGLTTSMVNGKIYAMGGSDAPYVPYFNTVEIYDPATDTWTSGTPMPNERMGHTAAVVNDKIYVMGGAYVAQTSTAYVDEYDPATDTWTAKAEMPTDRVFHCAGAVGGKIYVFGGCRYVNNVNISNLSAVDVYDPATDTWTTKGKMRSPRGLAAACVVNDMIYVFGGVVGDLGNAPIGTADVYDPATDSWKSIARAASRAASGICLIEDKIYVMGSGSMQGCSSRVDIYDPATDTWQTGPKLPSHGSVMKCFRSRAP